MKNLLTVLLITIPIFVLSQNKVGKVFYTEHLKLNIDFGDSMDEEMLKMIPKTRDNQKVLYFNESASLYTTPTDEEKEEMIESTSADGSMKTQFVFRMPEEKFFRDLENDKTIEKKEIFGKGFLIEKETKALAWKLTGQQKKIGTYACQQATYTKDSTIVEAWFSPQVPISAGPRGFDGLPGLVMEVITNDGDFIIRANKIVLEPIDESKLVAPKKGQRVSQEKFDAILEEKMKEQQMELGKGGGTIIKIDRH